MAPFESFQKLKILRIQTIYVFGTEVDGYEQDDEDLDIGDDGWDLEGDGNENEQEFKETHIKDTNWNDTSRRRFISFFPSTLEILHFTHCQEHLPRLLLALEDLLLYKSEQVPALSQLILEGDLYGEKELWGNLASLIAQGKERGVLVMCIQTRDDLWEIYPSRDYVDNEEWRIDRGWDGLNKGRNDPHRIGASHIVGLDTFDE